ncbi:LPXTG cell wall anchor domain-containing protein [Actinomadura sp. GC306]|uniref:neocarzinostatin apoprotein domain-containing protein n=1 Tax=Actinomadura sp. GC306 TaxID=2530367 RepID=UPI00104EE98E|nr:neocarzinostatin apoprotein domain-containing protein [Actinomadura sp. GC306]TDC70248.1 LPXTG cell wall anchor domain-containing protein [Actinomadura sp. GC306]
MTGDRIIRGGATPRTPRTGSAGFGRRAGAVAALAGACVLAFAPPALAAPQINASKTTGLKVGDTITVQVTGMSPNETFVTLGQCKPGPKLPNDCAGQDTGGAILGATDAQGNFVTKDGSKDAKIKLVAEAGGADCTAKAGACVLAVTAPGNQGPNTAEIPLTFTGGGGGGGGGGDDDGSGGGTGDGTGSGGGGGGTTGGGDLPNTGSPDGLPTYAMIASALVMAGGAALLIIPRRRRDHS